MEKNVFYKQLNHFNKCRKYGKIGDFLNVYELKDE